MSKLRLEFSLGAEKPWLDLEHVIEKVVESSFNGLATLTTPELQKILAGVLDLTLRIDSKWTPQGTAVCIIVAACEIILEQRAKQGGHAA